MAVYPVAAGLTSHSGTLTPEIWSGKTLVKFYLSTVFGEITNTDYEGEIKDMGDTVHIRTIPDMTISDYTVGMSLSYERPTTTVVDLLIDKGKYWAFSVNDVERIQSDLAYVEKWTDDAGQQLAIKIDLDILSNVYADVATANKGATAGAISSGFNLGVANTAVALSKSNILEWIVDNGTVLDESNVPESQRWLILPALFCGMVKKSDLKDASLAGDGTSIMRNGRLGMIDRFMLYRSNNIAPSTGEYNVMAGHPTGITFASQLVKQETLKNPTDFGDLFRGLQVYGYEMIKTDACTHSVIETA